jgi:hypothetical protein
MKRRPHWDDDLTDAVFRALSHTYRAQGWTGGIAIDLDESVYPLIAAVEDWHEKFVMHGAFRVLAERAASAEADRDRLANQLLNEVPDSYIQMKARALTAEAAIERVREFLADKDEGLTDDMRAQGHFILVDTDSVRRALDGGAK